MRASEQKLRMRKWEIGRYTLSQLLNALDQSDPNDPHAGGIEVRDEADFRRLLEELED
jgi:hypothetical protein